ncbi:MAG: helix-hairpin-helix domain-containing protein [Robiginitalea sp.]|nr:helix-hairpin-helix domain-containing protein [Robiginitalea sp.]
MILLLLQVASWGVPGLLGWHKREGLIRPDTLKQAELDRLRSQLPKNGSWTLRPFDPNNMEDFKGYLLGIPPQALDSLYAFRSRGGVLNGLDQFGRVSGLPDSTLQRLRPFLRFPAAREPALVKPPKPSPAGRDLNKVTAGELQAVLGVGPVLSRRIVKFRDALGGFLDPTQLYDVYGLEPAVAGKVMATFPLTAIPAVERVSINEGTVDELASILYLTREMARAIVARRDRLGPYESLQELRSIKSIPQTKIDRIALYLKL